MARLAPVLSTDDLPFAELNAIRLDGEVCDVAGAWSIIDVAEAPVTRASAVLAGRSPRLAGSMMTAAWIWGASAFLPRPLSFCVDVRSRARVRPGSGAHVSEVVLRDEDLVHLGEVRVTSHVRTMIDLARVGGDSTVIRSLGEAAGIDPRDLLERLGHHPGDGRARRVLTAR